MIHTAETTKKFRLVDGQGRKIPYVKSFNDETGEVELYVTTLDDNGKTKVAMSGESFQKGFVPVIVRTRIQGAKLVPIE